MIESKTCENGKYLKNDHCVWYFEVKSCKPSISCTHLHISGKVINTPTKYRKVVNYQTQIKGAEGKAYHQKMKERYKKG